MITYSNNSFVEEKLQQINNIKATVDTILNIIKIAKSIIDFINSQPKRYQSYWAFISFCILFLSILIFGNR